MLPRLVGLLFSFTVAGLTAWVAVGWSHLYVQVYDEFWPLEYFEQTAGILFAALGVIVGFTAASLIYRQAFDFAGDVVTGIRRIPSPDKAAVLLGLFMGLGLTALLGSLLIRIPNFGWQLTLLVGIVCTYLAVVITLSMKEELSFFFPAGKREAAEEQGPSLQPKLLDTNVIIDGRIADICRSGFLEGPIYVSSFVLEELHLIADSSDALKRNRGRRGLDILSQMQQEPGLRVTIFDDYKATFRHDGPVDTKLVHLAQDLAGVVVTNDYNLNKVARLQGVGVLNVNELANSVKPVVLPGEELTVSVVREGKEPGQGVAYLDDGTMVVVEQGKNRIGETIRINVTSVLQTVAGKMIFGAPREHSHAAEENSNRHDGADSRSGARGKT